MDNVSSRNAKRKEYRQTLTSSDRIQTQKTNNEKKNEHIFLSCLMWIVTEGNIQSKNDFLSLLIMLIKSFFRGPNFLMTMMKNRQKRGKT